MCSTSARWVGASSVPAVMLTASRPASFQKMFPPQAPQNPLSAVSEDLYQTRRSEFVNSMFADGALVMAA